MKPAHDARSRGPGLPWPRQAAVAGSPWPMTPGKQPVAQAGRGALAAAAAMCAARQGACLPPRCSTSGGHEWWPRLLQGEPEIDIEACEAGEAANLFTGETHRLRLQKVPAARLPPRVKQAATPCIQAAAPPSPPSASPAGAVTAPCNPVAPHHFLPPLTAPRRPSPPLQVELPGKRGDKPFSKEEAERAWRSTLQGAVAHLWPTGRAHKGPVLPRAARAPARRSGSLPARAVLPSPARGKRAPEACMRSGAALVLCWCSAAYPRPSDPPHPSTPKF